MMKLSVCVLAMVPLALSAGTDIFVSAGAGSGGDGSSAHPFATVREARDAARKAAKPVRVILGGGIHYLEDTLELGPEDSQVTWESAKDAVATISGGRRVSGWMKGEDGIWFAEVPWVNARSKGFRQLTVNGKLRPRARLPKKGYFTVLNDDLPEGSRYNVPRPSFFVDPKEFDFSWKGLDDAEIQTFSFWVDSHLRIGALDVVSNKVTFVTPCRLAFDTGWTNNKRGGGRGIYTIENFPAALTDPGEWRLEYSTGKVFYKPLAGEDPNAQDIVVPFVRHLVKISAKPWEDGRFAESIRFRNIRFTDAHFELPDGDTNNAQGAASTSSAIVLEGSRKCGFDRCEFDNISAYAVDMLAGVQDCGFRRCRMRNLGAGGFRLDGGQLGCHPFASNRGNIIADCDIGPFGRDFRSGVGVLLKTGESIKVVHNDIHDGFYSGISLGWTWGYYPNACRDITIGFNRIRNIGQGVLSDMGGIYTLGPSYGTRLVNNVISDVDARAYGGWGIYNDEGSTGILIENNVVYGTKFACYDIHYARESMVRNNIFAGGRNDQFSRTRRESHESAFIYNNIVYWKTGALFNGDWNDNKEYEYYGRPFGKNKATRTFRCDRNIYFNPGLNAESKVFPGGRNLEDWKKFGQDLNSIWSDPMFVNADAHDYNLKPESPAFKLGFRPIDLSQVGPRPAASEKGKSE